jgi:hypothetical protein
MQLSVEKKDLLKVGHLILEARETKLEHVKLECLGEALRILCDMLDLSRTNLRKDWLLGYYHGED